VKRSTLASITNLKIKIKEVFMILRSIKHYLQLGLLISYAGFAYGLDDNDIYSGWKAERAEQLAQPVEPVQPVTPEMPLFDVKRDITKPLKAFVREEIKPQMEFLESKIAGKATKIAKDTAQYGHVKPMSKYSPEYTQWRANLGQNLAYASGENISYPSAPSIIFEEDIPERKYQGFNDIARNLVDEGDELYREKKDVEAKLQNARFWEIGKKSALRNELAIINLDLDSVNNAIDELPLRKAHMRMRAQGVRQKRLQELKDIYANPADRFINDEAFAGHLRKFAGGPDESHLPGSLRSLREVWTPKIQHADQSGWPWLYRAYDDALQSAVMNKSDALREQARKQRKTIYSDTVWNEWLRDLNRLENERRSRRGLPPTPYGNWYAQREVEWRKERANRGW
jgi:hypothetical protein